MIGEVSGIVLAAGASTRMGERKQDLPIGDGTLLGRVIESAEASSLTSVVVVVAPGDPDPPVTRGRIVVNETPHRGSVSSLLTGLKEAGGSAVMVLLSDMPGVTTASIDRMLEAWRDDPRWAAIARYSDGPGHPLILSPYLAAALENRAGDKVLWPLLENADPAEVLFVDIDGTRPRDVNTPEDYAAALADEA